MEAALKRLPPQQKIDFLLERNLLDMAAPIMKAEGE